MRLFDYKNNLADKLAVIQCFWCQYMHHTIVFYESVKFINYFPPQILGRTKRHIHEIHGIFLLSLFDKY